MPKALLSAVAVFASFLAVTPTAFADSVSGTLDFFNSSTTPSVAYNAFNPAYNTPGGYVQTMNATFRDSQPLANGTNDSAVFDGTYLTIAAPASLANNYPFLMTFTDANFTGFSLVSNTFSNSSYGFSDGTFTFNSFAHSEGTPQAVFQYTDSADTPAPPNIGATPEPSSLVLLGTGMASFAGFARLRLLRRGSSAKASTNAGLRE